MGQIKSRHKSEKLSLQKKYKDFVSNLIKSLLAF